MASGYHDSPDRSAVRRAWRCEEGGHKGRRATQQPELPITLEIAHRIRLGIDEGSIASEVSRTSGRRAACRNQEQRDD